MAHTVFAKPPSIVIAASESDSAIVEHAPKTPTNGIDSALMPKLAPVAKILGPRGLMPSPKTETVTIKIKETVEMLKKGKISFKNDSTGVIHQVIGKLSFDAKKLEENYTAFIGAVQKAKPAGVKGKFMISVSVCSTMGPGIKIAL